ncbi:MAG: hypothetical protein ACI36X_00890 [Bacteroidaceae bacterium]
MKLRSIFYMMLMGVVLAFTACDDDDEVRTKTDVRDNVIGLTFSGAMVNAANEAAFCDDAVISFAEYTTNEKTWAVTFQFSSASKGLNLTGVVNPAKANEDITFSCGSQYPKLAGRLSGNDLIFYVPLNKAGTSLSNAATAVTYRFNGTKQ